MEHDIGSCDATGYLILFSQINGLRYLMNYVDRTTFSELSAQLDDRFLTHAIDNHVGTAVAEYAWAHLVLPVVIVGEATERCLYATQHDRHIRIEFSENARIDNGRVFGTKVMTAVGAVGILATKTLVGSIFVYHRIHTAGGNAKEKTWSAQLFKVAIVAVPVGLGNNSHTIAGMLKGATDDGSAKGRMIYISIATEENNINLVPLTKVQLFARGG